MHKCINLLRVRADRRGFRLSGLNGAVMLKQEANTASSDLTYLQNTTSLFQELADVLLVISTGQKLPAHSAYLTAHSSVFSGMLEAHFAGDSQKNGPAAIPLPDCSLQEAEAFLCYLYHLPTDVQLNPDSARAIVKLAHKFNVGTALQQCDEFLAHHMKQMPLWVSQLCTFQQPILPARTD